MSLLDRLEKALERLAEGSAERVFGGRLDLVAVGQELRNTAVEQSRSGKAGREAPDAYEVDLALEDFGSLVDVVEALQERYEEALWGGLREMGYVLATAPRVLITPREGLAAGRFETQARFTDCEPTCLLVELDADGRSQRARLPATIGRGADCDVVVQGEGVSRHHARIMWDRNRFAIVDLNSKNGTFVNGRRWTEGPVEPGDALMIGDRLLRLAVDRVPGDSGGPGGAAKAKRPR